MTRSDVLIVGSGHAGAQAAVALRKNRFLRTITVVGAEIDLPYERPALSKAYLAGDKSLDRILTRPEAFWVDRDIAFQRGRTVVSVDPKMHTVTCGDGGTIGYGTLIWAAGGEPRRLDCPGHDLQGVHYVRTRLDVDRILSDLPKAKRIVVIGGGYIGLEAAAVLIEKGLQVTVIEASDRVLSRVAAEPLSRFYEAEHRSKGVEMRTGETLVSLDEKRGRVAAVRLASGDVLMADMVIVGIGILPSVAPLLAAGATGGNGVDVDEFCRTSLPDVFAVGDCARHSNPYAKGASIRLESVQNAHDQAGVAANAITGSPVPYEAVPWFWSRQYDLNLQTVGVSARYDQTVMRGDPASRSFSLVYLRRGVVIALDCVNQTRDFVQGRKLVTERRAISPGHLADHTIPLSSWL